MRKIFVAIGIFVFLFGTISAMNIDFYYSPYCPHCQNVLPTIQTLQNQFSSNYYSWNWFDVTQGGRYNIQGVPTIKIKTDDCRNIEIVGDEPIKKQLKCELQEQSTLECPTFLDGQGTKGGSWFVN